LLGRQTPAWDDGDLNSRACTRLTTHLPASKRGGYPGPRRWVDPWHAVGGISCVCIARGSNLGGRRSRRGSTCMVASEPETGSVTRFAPLRDFRQRVIYLRRRSSLCTYTPQVPFRSRRVRATSYCRLTPDCAACCAAAVFLNAWPERSNGRAEGNQAAVLARVSDTVPSICGLCSRSLSRRAWQPSQRSRSIHGGVLQ